MRRRGSAAALFALASLALVVGAAGCAAPHPMLLKGDANSAEVLNSGDLAAAMAVAKRHCARFERAARFKMADMDTAYYDCIPR